MNLEFFIRLRDMMSGGLVKMGNTAQSVFAKVQNHVTRTTSRNKLLSASFDEIQNRIRQTEQVISRSRIPAEIRAARRELEQLQKMASRHSGNMGAGAGRATGGGGGGGMGMMGMVRGAIPLALLAGAMSLGTAAVTDGLTAQARSKSFEVMAGKQEGGALNANLTKYAQDSIYGNEVFQNAQTMMGMGIAAKDVMPDLKMLGDIAMGDANKLGALTYAFSQVASGQKLMGNDMIQFINAGFNPLQIISEKTGVSIGVLKDQMSEGLITFDHVKAAFKTATSEGGRFYNMTNEIAKTDFGKVQAFKGALEGLSVRIGGMLAPAIGGLITNFLNPLLDLLNVGITFLQEKVFPAFQDIPVGDFFNNLLASAQTIVTALMPVFDALKPVFLTLAEVLGPIFARFVEFTTFLAVKLGPTITNIARIFSALMVPIIRIVTWLIMKVFDLLTTLLDWASPVLEWITGMLAGLAETLGVLLGVDPKKAEQDKPKITDVKPKPDPSKPESPGGTSMTDAFAGIKANAASSAESSVKGVASGGPRVININGVKFVEKLEIHAASFEKGMDQAVPTLEEYFLRLLNSGARLQS